MPKRPLYPQKQTLVAQERFGLEKRTLDVCLTPESGRNWVTGFMSAYDPKRKFWPSLDRIILSVVSPDRFGAIFHLGGLVGAPFFFVTVRRSSPDSWSG
jgi:hypothetical protein